MMYGQVTQKNDSSSLTLPHDDVTVFVAVCLPPSSSSARPQELNTTKGRNN